MLDIFHLLLSLSTFLHPEKNKNVEEEGRRVNERDVAEEEAEEQRQENYLRSNV